MNKLSTVAFGLVALVTTGACAASAMPAAAGPSHLAARSATERASRLSNVEVTAIDERARTFTVAVVLSAARLSELPGVGESVDLTYGGSPGALAATTVKSGKSNSSDRAATAGEVPRLSGVEVTAVDRRARSFTVAVVFSAAGLTELPAVGARVDVTYAEAPGGGPLKASNLDFSKSNVN